MRHRLKGKKLGRTASPRKALIRALANSLIQQSRITTTVAKAKTIRPVVERYITIAKKNSVSQRRQLLKTLSPMSVKILLDKHAKTYATRNGGYTRIIHLSQRPGDGTHKAIIELV